MTYQIVPQQPAVVLGSRVRLPVLAAMAVGALCAAAPAASADTVRFDYTGGEQVFVVPAGVSQVDVVAVGARGGVGQAGFGGTVDAPGGFGAVARATLTVTSSQTLYVEVGGNGADGYATAGQGGFNGGGAGGVGSGNPVFNFGAGGGGASDVRTSSRTDPTGARLITAGGGGGGGNGLTGYGGAGGSAGAAGGPGSVRVAQVPCTPGGGGTPGGASGPGAGGAAATIPAGSVSGTAGSNGSLGAGGAGGNEYDIGGGGGGGGGGLYGGGGGGGGAAAYPGNVATCSAGGGGGGSSGFAAAATNRSLEIDGSGISSVTFLWSPPASQGAPDSPSPPTPPVDPAPSIVSLSLTNRTFRVGPRQRGGSRRVDSGTAFSLSLSEAARITFTVERHTIGRRVRGRCRAATRRNRRARRCTRYVRVGSFTKQLQAGPQRVAWSGRLRNRALPPARYRAILQARDTGNLLSASRTVSFRVVR